MSDWRALARAPKPGRFVVTRAALDGRASFSVDLEGFPVLLVKYGAEVFAYFNACPHQYLPLDWRSPNVLSADGTVIRCSNHSAGFDARTGHGVDGLGKGCALIPVPIEILGDEIIIARG